MYDYVKFKVITRKKLAFSEKHILCDLKVPSCTERISLSTTENEHSSLLGKCRNLVALVRNGKITFFTETYRSILDTMIRNFFFQEEIRLIHPLSANFRMRNNSRVSMTINIFIISYSLWLALPSMSNVIYRGAIVYRGDGVRFSFFGVVSVLLTVSPILMF